MRRKFALKLTQDQEENLICQKKFQKVEMELNVEFVETIVKFSFVIAKNLNSKHKE
jgi:hypothetical protein